MNHQPPAVSYTSDCHFTKQEERVPYTHHITVGPTTFAPCSGHYGMVHETTNDDFSVVLALFRGAVGLYDALTPDGARALAKSLNQMADMVDQKVAEQATTALVRAKNGGTQ